jgi:hypothetical protein
VVDCLNGICVLAAQLPTVKDPAALLALPPLSQVHLQSRMSPEELRKRAERAEMVAKVRPHKLLCAQVATSLT